MMPSTVRVRILPPRRHQGGFSLVELMIAVTLSLLISFAVVSIFIGSRQSFRTQTGMSQVQEEARHAQLLVTPIVRLAGYLPNPALQPDPSSIFKTAQFKQALSGNHNSAPSSANYPGFGATVAMATTTPNDALIVTYAGQDATDQAPMFDCRGDTIASNQTVTNIFYVSAPDNTGASSLYCYTNITTLTGALSAAANTNTDALIAGVTNMVVLYGIDTDADNVPNQYVDAGSVTNWTLVRSVRITLTIASADAVDVNGLSLGSSSSSSGAGMSASGRVQRTYTTTVQIRNRLTS